MSFDEIEPESMDIAEFIEEGFEGLTNEGSLQVKDKKTFTFLGFLLKWLFLFYFTTHAF